MGKRSSADRALDVRGRIDYTTIFVHFEVHMRAG